jgi:type VI secretion system protein ImpE
MDAKQLYEAGRLAEAIGEVTGQVKARPADTAARTLLFELLCFAGELDRADKQLDAIAQLDAQSEWAVQVYRNLLHAERARRRLFSAGQKPEFLLDPPPYVGACLDAVNRLREDDLAAARASLDLVDDAFPTLSGSLDGVPFDEFRDCDDLDATILEVIILRDYAWVPLEQVRLLEITPPERPRDLIWAPARLTMMDESQRSVYLPVLYHRSYEHHDEQVKLGRATDWMQADNGTALGSGMRTWLAGEQAAALLECRRLEFAASQ